MTNKQPEREEKIIEKCCTCYEPAPYKCGHCETPYCGIHHGTTVMTGNCCSGNEKMYE